MKKDGILAAVRCASCELVQFPQPQCRRCRRTLPVVDQPAETRVEVREVERIVFAGDELPQPVMFGNPLPNLHQVEEALIVEAIKRCGSPLKAAEAIGIGKTTLYRKLAAMKEVTA